MHKSITMATVCMAWAISDGKHIDLPILHNIGCQFTLYSTVFFFFCFCFFFLIFDMKNKTKKCEQSEFRYNFHFYNFFYEVGKKILI